MYFTGTFRVSNEVSPEELIELVRIFIVSFNGEPWFERWDFDSAKECLSSQLTSGQLILCQDSHDKIIGFGISLPLKDYQGCGEFLDLGAEIDDYYISEIAVDPEHRRHGIARCIIGLFVSIGKKVHQNILLRTRIDNAPVHRIVKQLGFDQIAEYQTSNGGVLSPRIVFRLKS